MADTVTTVTKTTTAKDPNSGDTTITVQEITTTQQRFSHAKANMPIYSWIKIIKTIKDGLSRTRKKWSSLFQIGSRGSMQITRFDADQLRSKPVILLFYDPTEANNTVAIGLDTRSMLADAVNTYCRKYRLNREWVCFKYEDIIIGELESGQNLGLEDGSHILVHRYGKAD